MQAGLRQTEILVRAPVLSRTDDGGWRVAADIGGTAAYVESHAPLVANGDAWAAAMLLPAAKAGATLRIESDVDARLHANFAGIQAIAREYWGFAGAQVVAQRLLERPRAGGDAMFFTCGLDSFYTLRRYGNALDRLIYVHGFDIRLDDVARYEATRSWITQVAAEVGVRPVFARTNLREHPLFAALPWGTTHIAALAMVAHAMAAGMSRIYIASSDTPPPWGSQPQLDPLWSSNAVEIVNDGSESLKPAKARAVADWSLVHRFLRVCWENESSALNCGVCMKCVRTQILFGIAGARGRLRTFPQLPLPALVDGISSVPPADIELWRGLLVHIGDPGLKAAIVRLLERRPTAVDRLKGKAVWMRKTATGRWLRRAAKRLLAR